MPKNKIVKEIAENFDVYSDLRNDRKTITISPIKCERKLRHINYNIGRVPATHQKIKESLEVEVEVKITDHRNFKFKVFCSNIFERPFFRFDSDGAYHWNRFDDVEFKKQQVEPPHFHQFNKNGIEIAYRTKSIINKKTRVDFEDIHKALILFCKEGNIRYGKSGFPSLNLFGDELPLKFVVQDPIKHVKF